MSQVEAELLEDGVRDFAHLDGLDLLLLLRRSSEFERVELAEHLHVTSKLELLGLNNGLLRLSDLFSIDGLTHLHVFLLDLLALLIVFKELSVSQEVVLLFELNPLAGLLGQALDALLEFDLLFTENCDILALVLLTVSLKSLLSNCSFLGLKHTLSLSHDDGAEDKVVIPLECAVDLGLELAMSIKGFAHGELWVVVLRRCLGILFASPQVAEHCSVYLNVYASLIKIV